jgi:peptide/nickel transport system substrate-binding protein
MSVKIIYGDVRMNKKILFILLAAIIVIAAIAGGYLLTQGPEEEAELYMVNVVCLEGGQETMDPHATAATFDLFADLLCYEQLVRIKPGQVEVEAQLAESWEVSDDGLTYTFHLKDGVKFHDGTPFNASAVKWNFDRMYAIDGPSMTHAVSIDRYEVVDNLTFKIVLNQVDMVFIWEFALEVPFMFMSPTYVEEHATEADPWAKDWMQFNECGTGPYELVEWTPLVKGTYEHWEDYRGGWKSGQVGTVNILEIPESATQLMQLLAGDLDYASSLSFEDLDQVDPSPNARLVALQGTYATNIWLNTRNPPLDNILVRQAFCHAFDFDSYVNDAMLGYAKRSDQHHVSTDIWYNPDITKYDFNLTKAAELLELAGYPGGEGIPPLSIHSVAGKYDWRTACLALQDGLAQLGVTLNLEQMTGAEWMSSVREGAADIYPLNSYRTAHPITRYLRYLSTASIPPAGWNLAYYGNETWDNMIHQMRTAVDEDTAKALALDFQEQVQLQYICIPVSERPGYFGLNERIQGYKGNPILMYVIYPYEWTVTE